MPRTTASIPNGSDSPARPPADTWPRLPGSPRILPSRKPRSLSRSSAPTSKRSPCSSPPPTFLDWGGKAYNFSERGELLFNGGVAGHAETDIAEQARKLSPARLVAGPTPPFLFIHGDADPLVPLQQSQKMVDALKAAGNSAELIVKAGGGHPWLTIRDEVGVMADWFDRQLAPRKVGTRQHPETP